MMMKRYPGKAYLTRAQKATQPDNDHQVSVHARRMGGDDDDDEGGAGEGGSE